MLTRCYSRTLENKRISENGNHIDSSGKRKYNSSKRKMSSPSSFEIEIEGRAEPQRKKRKTEVNFNCDKKVFHPNSDHPSNQEICNKLIAPSCALPIHFPQ